MKKYILLISFSIISTWAFSQKKDIALADEYFAVSDYKKAVDVYSRYILKIEFQGYIYENYRVCEVELENYNSLSKTLKKITKKNPENYLYLVDLIEVEKFALLTKDYNKDYKRLYNIVKDASYEFYQVAQQLKKRKMYIELSKLIIAVRKHRKDSLLYIEELIAVYVTTGNSEKLINEALFYLRSDPSQLEKIENLFQSYFKEKDYSLLEVRLYQLIAQESHYSYRELLVWYHLQQKDFYEAFVQQRAIDISKQERGYGLFNIAQIAIANNNYQDAINILEYICETYTHQEIYVKAKTTLIEIKQIQLESNFPVDISHINQLLVDYNELLISAHNQDEKAQIQQNQAKIYAFYLHDNQKSLELLTKITNTPGISRNRQANAWLLLGDIYLFDNQIGEASLTYFNVENKWKNSTYAEMAKYKNAQLYFYSGEFDLSQSMLDILKRATSRAISNDAIDLSIFIKANSGLDTSYDALQLYADADLLFYQKKFDSALHTFDDLLTKFPSHSLTDEIYWAKSKVYTAIKQDDKQLEVLKLLVDQYGDDIWADDAVFVIAEILEKKRDRESAMLYYKSILIDYQGSIYTENARLAYRRLRGDGL
jgi:TolA-binding protein